MNALRKISALLLVFAVSVILMAPTLSIAADAPLILLNKTASDTQVDKVPTNVTFVFEVSNPGTKDLNTVVLIDDKVLNLTFLSGDLNADQILQPNEVWIYSGNMTVRDTVTSMGIVTANSNGTAVKAVNSVTVALSNSPTDVEVPVVTTEGPTLPASFEVPGSTIESTSAGSFEVPGTTGVNIDPEATEATNATEETTVIVDSEEVPEAPVTLPQTATPLFVYLVAGVVLMMLGFMVLKVNKKV